MAAETKKVREARVALADAIQEQAKNREEKLAKNVEKHVDKCFKETGGFINKSTKYTRIVGNTVRYKRSLPCEIITVGPNTLMKRTTSYDIVAIRPTSREEISLEEYLEVKDKVEQALDYAQGKSQIFI